MTNKFKNAKEKIAEVISQSKIKTDPGHSLNTLYWLLELESKADEILQLAALAHDIERGMSDRLTRDMFKSYEEYKIAHATRAGELAASIIQKAGYSLSEAQRLSEIIKHAETGNNNPDVQLVMDADSISYFDFNIECYLEMTDEKTTKKKMNFMYNRASSKAQRIIDNILANKPKFKKLFE